MQLQVDCFFTMGGESSKAAGVKVVSLKVNCTKVSILAIASGVNSIPWCHVEMRLWLNLDHAQHPEVCLLRLHTNLILITLSTQVFVIWDCNPLVSLYMRHLSQDSGLAANTVAPTWDSGQERILSYFPVMLRWSCSGTRGPGYAVYGCRYVH